MTAFVKAHEVAQLTGFCDGNAFLRARDRLERYEDFPPPMPTCRRPLIWRSDAIIAWLETVGQAGGPAAPIATGSNVVLLNEARTA